MQRSLRKIPEINEGFDSLLLLVTASKFVRRFSMFTFIVTSGFRNYRNSKMHLIHLWLTVMIYRLWPHKTIFPMLSCDMNRFTNTALSFCVFYFIYYDVVGMRSRTWVMSANDSLIYQTLIWSKHCLLSNVAITFNFIMLKLLIL